MPNHVTSRFTVTGPADDVAAIHALVVKPAPANHSDAGSMIFDFDVVIPMPAILKDGTAEASSHAEMGASMILYRADRGAPYADHAELWSKAIREELGMKRDSISDVAATYLALHPDIEAKGRDRLRAILETGYASWHPWSVANWGTKWDAYRYSEEALGEGEWVFQFETAWSFPEPILVELAKRFPTLTFDCLCYDEGSNFAGIGQFGAAADTPFRIVDATPELYERVYGHPEPSDEDEA